MTSDDVSERVLRWAPGVGAGVVGAVALLVSGLILFDLSLDRVSVDGLADDGQVDRPGDDLSIGGAPGDDGGDDADGDGGEAGTPRRLGAPLHVLVAGSDDRSVLTREERRELSTGDADGERMEALALVRIDPDHDRLDVLRFPRDLLVTRCDGTRGRINAAYAIGERNGVGGASCLVETISDWSGIPIHHVVKVDFRGFVDVVEAVGGVEMSFDEPLHDERAGLDLPAGCVRLDGADALAFVRARHLDDDFGRIERQQELIAATLDQVLTASTLRDPRRLGLLITTAQRSLQLDDGMTAQRLRAVVATVARLDSEDLTTRTVDGEIQLSDEGISFLHAHDRHAEMLFAAFAAGDLPDAPVDAAAADATAEETATDETAPDDLSEPSDEDDDAAGGADQDASPSADDGGEAGTGC